MTTPLSNALTSGQIHHAYLFSGPRGCGKTSSARIMARSLNCEKGPTPNPCGICQSCKDLVANGPGSLDVIELDAATHGLVDDARDLRDKAFFAPVSSRYKIYIIDEAHQLGPGAANALLKVVEEPPAHVLFIFATTEPDKLISTIRSRTHHYPFRLVPPAILTSHLEKICDAEGIKVAKGVIPLVVRASGGSVRDALSVLGQLLAGASDDGVTYEIAVALLGYTDGALLDEAVDALAARAAQLRKIELIKPKNVIGKNTVEALQSGTIFGFAGQVDGLVDRITTELADSYSEKPIVIATGGLAPLIVGVSETIEHYEPDLTLIGLRLIHERNA